MFRLSAPVARAADNMWHGGGTCSTESPLALCSYLVELHIGRDDDADMRAARESPG